eukprot:7939542-Lingulodinium_polyedra.AAC.1
MRVNRLAFQVGPQKGKGKGEEDRPQKYFRFGKDSEKGPNRKGDKGIGKGGKPRGPPPQFAGKLL